MEEVLNELPSMTRTLVTAMNKADIAIFVKTMNLIGYLVYEDALEGTVSEADVTRRFKAILTCVGRAPVKSRLFYSGNPVTAKKTEGDIDEITITLNNPKYVFEIKCGEKWGQSIMDAADQQVGFITKFEDCRVSFLEAAGDVTRTVYLMSIHFTSDHTEDKLIVGSLFHMKIRSLDSMKCVLHHLSLIHI